MDEKIEMSLASNWKAVIKRFLVIFLPLSILLSSITMAFYYTDIRTERIIFEAKEKRIVELQMKTITGDLKSIVSDLMFLSENYSLQEIYSSGETSALKAKAQEFLVFSDKKALYDQIRLIDKTGMEVIRIDYNKGRPIITPENELQSKPQRYYFINTFRLGRGEVYASPFDLNIEHGKIERPLKPVIHFGTPVFDKNGQKRGILVLNYLGAKLIKNIKKVSVNLKGQVMLLNSGGYWLYGPKPEDEWGFMFENGSNRTFRNAFPRAWEQIYSSNAGQFRNEKGMFTYTTVHPLSVNFKTGHGREKINEIIAVQDERKNYYWKIVSYVPPDIMNINRHKLFSRISKIYYVLIIVLALGSWSLARVNVKRKLAEEAVAKYRDHLEELVKERTRELEAAQDELVRKERLAALGQLTATVSHEIRNPLGTIRSSIFTIDERSRGKGLGVERALDRVVRNIERCDTIIDELLDYTRIKDLKMESTVIDEWIGEILDEQNIPSGIALRRELTSGIKLKIGRERLRRAVINIIQNSCQAVAGNNEGGNGNKLIVKTCLSENRFEIRFTDTGNGISHEELDKIFEPLYSTKSFGVGLGLPIVKQIMEQHHGGIELNSEKDKGTTVILWLPIQKEGMES